MAHRLVIDAGGRAWNVWSVRPDDAIGRGALTVAPQYANGWLAFERADAGGEAAEKRRIAPVPSDWEGAPDEAVLSLLEAAVPVQRRRMPVS
jgi:hypothetical protein